MGILRLCLVYLKEKCKENKIKKKKKKKRLKLNKLFLFAT